MSFSSSLLTVEQVASWVKERADVARQHLELGARLEQLDKKLDAVRLLLPVAEAAALLDPGSEKKRSEWHSTDYVLDVLQRSTRGFTPAEVKAVLVEDPEFGDRARKSMTLVSNALLRLAAKDVIVKDGTRYYSLKTYEAVQNGEIEDVAPEKDATSFNALMHQAMRPLREPFTAAKALEVGREHPGIGEKLKDQPGRVYSWLSREVSRNNLIKTGELYSYPVDENGAAQKAAPDDEGGATPSFMAKLHDVNRAFG